MNVKRKGSDGERELVELLRSAGINAHRNDQMYTGGKNNPDVYAEINGQPLHIEVKRVERLNILDAMKQAISDAAAETFPVVVHRKNRSQWLITMPLTEWLRFEGISTQGRGNG